jgi:hypothetical protein
MDLWFPVSTEGEVKRSNLEKWIAKRQRKETLLKHSASEFDRMDMARCLGRQGKTLSAPRGKCALASYGQVIRRGMRRGAKGGKRHVARRMLSRVRQDGGRFLRKERDGWWTEIPKPDALDKISKLFTSVKASWPR